MMVGANQQRLFFISIVLQYAYIAFAHILSEFVSDTSTVSLGHINFLLFLDHIKYSFIESDIGKAAIVTALF